MKRVDALGIGLMVVGVAALAVLTFIIPGNIDVSWHGLAAAVAFLIFGVGVRRWLLSSRMPTSRSGRSILGRTKHNPGAARLASVEAHTIAIGCRRCDHRSEHSVAELVGKYGGDIGISELIELLAINCPRLQKQQRGQGVARNDQCGARMVPTG